MKPPRRWMVWLVVLVMGAVSLPIQADARPRALLVLPSDLKDDASGDPDVPVNPRPSAELRLTPFLSVGLTTGRPEWFAVVVVVLSECASDLAADVTVMRGRQ